MCGYNFSTHLGEYQKAHWLDHGLKRLVCLVLQKLPNCLPQWLYVPFCILSSSAWESSCCSTSSRAFDVVAVLDCSLSSEYVVVSHSYVNLQFPNDMMWSSFLVRCLFLSFVDLKKNLLLSFNSSLYIFGYQSFAKYVLCKYFLLALHSF